MVYLDVSGDGVYNNDTTGDLEPSCVTSTDGSFEFHRLDDGIYPVNIVLPSGYVIDDTSPSTIPLSADYSGTPIQVHFTIRKEN